MELLESEWFFRMVEAQGKTPAERLTAVFSVLEAWIAAPGVRDMLLRDSAPHACALHSSMPLKAYLTAAATAAKAENPSSLADQLLILLQGAIAQEARNPGMNAVGEAAKAARAVVAKACRDARRRRDRIAGGLAAAVAAIAIGYTLNTRHGPADGASPAAPLTAQRLVAASLEPAAGSNPDNVYAVLALQERIAQGICPAPQLLALPPGQATAYLNIINFRTPDNPAADRENIRAFLAWFEKTRSSECYSPPANGHTNVAWVSRQIVTR